jgi:hypothetical protein
MYSFENSSDYSSFLFSLEDKFPEIENSQINFFSIEPDLFLVKGAIEFNSEIKLTFHEVINFSKQRIVRYAYEVYRKNELLCFYDPQEHPDDSNLASTFPHHKHIHPNIKRNRQPAPGISFTKPNLLFLIQEIIDQLL